MADYIMVSNKCKEVSNAVIVSVSPCDNRYTRTEKSSEEVCDRFLKAASTLPSGEYLGWEFGIKDEGEISCLAFSSADADVTAEDFHWIVESGSSAEQNLSAGLEDYFWKDRRVYVFLPKQTNKISSDSNDDGYWLYPFDDSGYSAGEKFKSLLDMLKSADGVFIRILAYGSGGEDRDAVIIIWQRWRCNSV